MSARLFATLTTARSSSIYMLSVRRYSYTQQVKLHAAWKRRAGQPPHRLRMTIISGVVWVASAPRGEEHRGLSDCHLPTRPCLLTPHPSRMTIIAPCVA